MAFAYVTSWSDDSGSSTAASNTLTISGATSGNLLIGVVGIRSTVATATFNTPTGWNKVSDGADTVGGAFYWRIASGTTADNLAADWGISKRWAMAASEFSGIDATPFETSAENESQLNSTTQTITTGSATPSTAGAAIAIIASDMDGAPSASNYTINSSFTVRVESGATVGARARVAIASLDLSSTSAVNPQWTSAATVAGQYAAVATFAETGTGGGATPKGPLGHPLHGPFGGPL